MHRIAFCHCASQHILHFENTSCIRCQAPVAYLPDLGTLAPLNPESDEVWNHGPTGNRYRPCSNRSKAPDCNWMVPVTEAEGGEVFCAACRLNEIVPDLSVPGNSLRWKKLETAKRRLVSLLLDLGLPVVAKGRDPQNGLAFRFMADTDTPAVTGHAAGVVTINIREADDEQREAERVRLGEMHRTLLGHFRHEVGHYYWERLVRDGGHLQGFREMFGDERADYAECLERHYRLGPPTDWPTHFISAYASAHPWEDWAETWMHYLLMRDTLSTLADLRRIGYGVTNLTADTAGFDGMLTHWRHLTLAATGRWHAGYLSVRPGSSRHRQTTLDPRFDRLGPWHFREAGTRLAS